MRELKMNVKEETTNNTKASKVDAFDYFFGDVMKMTEFIEEKKKSK